MKKVTVIIMMMLGLLLSCHTRQIYDIKNGMSPDDVIKAWGKTPDIYVLSKFDKDNFLNQNPQRNATQDEINQFYKNRFEFWFYNFSGDTCVVLFQNNEVITRPQCQKKAPSNFETNILPALIIGAAISGQRR
jgi:hypothetical protein